MNGNDEFSMIFDYENAKQSESSFKVTYLQNDNDLLKIRTIML